MVTSVSTVCRRGWVFSFLLIATSLPAYADSTGEWVLPILYLAFDFPATITDESPTVRLVGGVVPYKGRLQVLYNGTWGTVCYSFFGNIEGAIVCRQLNYTGVQSVKSEMSVAGEPIWLDDVECTGSENSLLNCSHRGFGVHNCDHMEDVWITCGKSMDQLIIASTKEHIF